MGCWDGTPGESFKVAKREGRRFSTAELLYGFSETGDITFRAAYRDVLHFLHGVRAWIKPPRWADTLAYACAYGAERLNTTARAEILATGSELLAGPRLLDELEVVPPLDELVADASEATGDRSPTDLELANAEYDGGEPLVGFSPALWR